MIALILGLAWAGAPEPGELSTDRKQPTTVWIVEGAQALDSDGLSYRCERVVHEHPELPAGLRALAHEHDSDRCEGTWVFLDLPMEIHSERRSKWVHTDFAAVSTTPPRRTPWTRAKGQGTAWIKTWGDKPLHVIPLEDPHWVRPHYLGHGEVVEVLDRTLGVVRTSTGRVVLLHRGDYALSDVDPLLDRMEPEERALHRRFNAGRPAHEAKSALVGVPPSRDLEELEPRDQPFDLVFDADDLSGEVFVADWLDPVRQVLRAPCQERHDRIDIDPEACGTYVLDYTAFGAWWPDQEHRVVALYSERVEVDGEKVPVLEVVVKEPWTKHTRVSPAWSPGLRP